MTYTGFQKKCAGGGGEGVPIFPELTVAGARFVDTNDKILTNFKSCRRLAVSSVRLRKTATVQL